MRKKQNIIVKGRAANERIEASIPLFEQRFGWKKSQATAVAIRLESVGRLRVNAMIKPEGLPRKGSILRKSVLPMVMLAKKQTPPPVPVDPFAASTQQEVPVVDRRQQRQKK